MSIVNLISFQCFLGATPAANAGFFSAKAAKAFNELAKDSKMAVRRIDYGMGKRALEVTFKLGTSKAPKIIIEDTAPDVLKNFSIWNAVKDYSRSITDYSGAVKQFAESEGLKGAAGSAAKAAKEKLIRFPQEALIFFIGLGALNYLQMLQSPELDPLIMSRHIDAQYNPVGQIGFASFMMASGVSEHFLMEPIRAQAEFIATTNQLKSLGMSTGNLKTNYMKFASKVPFFGMTIGSIASNVVHEIFGPYQENAKCSVDLKLSEEIRKHCLEELWSLTHVKKVFSVDNMIKWSPNILSMLVSTYLSGFITSALNLVPQSINQTLQFASKAFARFSERQIIKISEVTLLKGVAGIMRGVGVVFSVSMPILNIVMFTGLDQLILPLFEITIINFKKSWIDHKSLDVSLVNLLSDMRQNNWSLKNDFKLDSMNKMENLETLAMIQNQKQKEKYEEFLEKFSTTVQDWKNYNLSEVLQAHASWEELLGTLTSTYRATSNFYKTFLIDFHNRKNQKTGKFRNSFQSIDLPYPMMGIYNSENEFNIADNVHYPYKTMKSQIEKILEIKNQLDPIFEENKERLNLEDRKVISELLNSMGGLAHNRLTIYNGFSDDSDIEVGLKSFMLQIEKLNLLVEAKNNELPELVKKYSNYKESEIYIQRLSMSEAGVNFLKATRQILGNPYPLFQKGRGYFILNDFMPEFQSANMQASSVYFGHCFWCYKLYQKGYSGNTPAFFTPNLGDYMTLGMFFGAEVGRESLINRSNGFPAIFIPPQIIKNKLNDMIFEISAGEFNDVTRTALVLNESAGVQKKYKSMYEYLVKHGENNLNSNFYNEDHQQVLNYWTENIESQYIKTWAEYEKMYVGIISRLVEKIKGTDEKSLPKLGFLPNLKKFWDTHVNKTTREAFTSNESGDIYANRGVLASNPLKTLEQEYKTYLLLLSELVSGTDLNKKLIKSKITRVVNQPNDPINYTVNTKADDQVKASYFAKHSLIEHLRDNKVFNVAALQTNRAQHNNYLFIEDILKQTENIYLYIQKIRTEFDSNGNEKLSSNIDIKKLVKLQKDHAELVQRVGVLFGIEELEKNCTSLMTLTDEKAKQDLIKQIKDKWSTENIAIESGQKRFIQSVLLALVRNADEVAQIITIANAVSYKVQHDKDLKEAADSLKKQQDSNTQKIKPKAIGVGNF